MPLRIHHVLHTLATLTPSLLRHSKPCGRTKNRSETVFPYLTQTDKHPPYVSSVGATSSTTRPANATDTRPFLRHPTLHGIAPERL